MATRTRQTYRSFPRARRARRRGGGVLSTATTLVAALILAAYAYATYGEDALPDLWGGATPAETAERPAGASASAGRGVPSGSDATADILRGRASVIDGDTLDIGATRVRLSGVDAPESGQKCADADGKLWRCGAAAANALDRFINGATVTCRIVDTDRYGRSVSACSARETDLQDWLARNGYALAYRAYSTDYVEAEEAAQAARAGVWAGDFVNPADWRKGARLPQEPATQSARKAGSSAPT